MHVVHMFQCHAVFFCDAAAVPGENRIIGGMFVKAADAAGGKNSIFAVDLQRFSVGRLGSHAGTLSVFHQNVGHGGVFHDGDIGKSLHGAQEDGGDFLPGHIFVKTDAGPGVSAFLCVEKGSVRIFGETDAQTEQMVDDGTAAPDHDIDALPAILVMAGPHGILKVGIVIIVIPEDADAALGQHGIAGGKAALGQKQYFLVGRQVEGSVEPCNAAAGDGRVKV